MLHSQFVPHIVATVPQNWLGLGHAAFVQKSWLDCGKSLLHTKLGSHHVFFAAMLHSQFVPHIVATMCPKTGSVLAMQPLCRSHGLDCGTQSLCYTPQNWLGLGHAAFVQKSWFTMCFFAAMLHSQFVPHIVANVPQNWLGLGHAARSHAVVNHYYTQNWGLTMCFLAEVMVGLW